MNKDFMMMSASEIITAILQEVLDQENIYQPQEAHVVEGSLSPVIDDPAYLLTDQKEQ